MRKGSKHLSIALLPLAVCGAVFAQVPLPASPATAQSFSGPAAASSPDSANFATAALSPRAQALLAFRDSDVKFEISRMMEILRDRRHEGWVLAAYPDPKTGRPLIGAGFSLDLPAREHVQRDPLNPHPFLEPSSAELWQAAGLDPQRLQGILKDYDDRLVSWNTRTFRRNLGALTPQITGEEATLLLRVAVIQSIYNAKAYCRNFDRLSMSQQMAMSQLVYQMGVNLEEFSQFLSLINSDSRLGPDGAEAQLRPVSAADFGYWRAVQESLEQSQWARLYRSRAIAVIAMLDPGYSSNPLAAERRVGAVLAPVRRHRGRVPASRQLASARRKSNPGKAGRARAKRTA